MPPNHSQQSGTWQPSEHITIELQHHMLFMISSLFTSVSLTTHTHNHDQRSHQSAKCRYTLPSPASHMSWLEAICHWWTPQAEHTQRRDSFDVNLTWFLHLMTADCRFCSRDRKDSHVCSIFTHIQLIHLSLIYCKRLPTVLFSQGASWLNICRGIQPNLVIYKKKS